MPNLTKYTKFLAICCFGLLLQASFGFAQTEETATVKSFEDVDKSFLFDGESPQTIEQLKFMEQHFAEISEKVKAATVNIQMGQSQGSGVVVSSDGYILTAAHVIGGPNQAAKITFIDSETGKQKTVDAETLGSETGIDSGMLKIDEDEGDDFPYLDIAISDELNEGQWVMAVGHPGGIDVDRGLVVRIGRIIYSTKRVIKTDCTLVGGDSGGPLIDMNGDVIGIHSRIGSKLVDNLHVPADIYTTNWDLLAKGIIIDGRPSLGFRVVEDTNEIETVYADGAADEAGIKKGDVLIKIGSIEVEDKEDIFNAIERLKLRPNVVTELVVLRNGEEEKVELTVGDRNREVVPKKKSKDDEKDDDDQDEKEEKKELDKKK